MNLIALVSIVLALFVHCEWGVLLFETEKRATFERYDCVYYTRKNESIPYCRRPYSVSLPHEELFNTCQNGGILVNFSILIANNITPHEVLQWSSSVEMADIFASVYYSRTTRVNYTLCNCTKSGTFGKYCEYELTHDVRTVEEAIEKQFDVKRANPSGIQKHGNILCYKTVECDYGLLCLDWRDICDGVQQCMQGKDEENCDKLEFNECEENEYRCTNGMCIPEEFWLDGKLAEINRS